METLPRVQAASRDLLEEEVESKEVLLSERETASPFQQSLEEALYRMSHALRLL